MDDSVETCFACDAMLGGLARWLRAAGYDAWWQPDIGDHDLIRLSRYEGRTLLSSDSKIFLSTVIRDGVQPALFVPLRLTPIEQLGFVLGKLRLDLREPRCMACGGILLEAPKAEIQSRVPPRTYAWLEHFWQCNRCCHVFWQGTHWHRIVKSLCQATAHGSG